MLTLEDLKEMERELNWSGTAGLNIPAQQELVSTLIAYMEEEGEGK